MLTLIVDVAWREALLAAMTFCTASKVALAASPYIYPAKVAILALVLF